MYKDGRPKNAVLLIIFFSIQDDTDPHNTSINFEFFLNCISQVFFNLPKNVGSSEPIQEISSSKITTLPFSVCCANSVKRLPQSSILNLGMLNFSLNCRANSSR